MEKNAVQKEETEMGKKSVTLEQLSEQIAVIKDQLKVSPTSPLKTSYP